MAESARGPGRPCWRRPFGRRPSRPGGPPRRLFWTPRRSSSRQPSEPPAALERALYDLAGRLDTGPVPDVAPAVLDRIQQPHRRRVAWRRAAAIALASSLLLVLIPGVRTAVAEFVRGLPGVLFETRPQPVPSRVPATSLGGSPAFGRPLPLEEARQQVGFPVLVPQALGPPDEVYVRGNHAVTLLWRSGPGLPPLAGSDIGAVVDVIDPLMGDRLQKWLPPTDVQQLTIDGHEAVWIGRPHPVVLLDADGHAVVQRLAARTLLIHERGVTVRIESLLSRDRAVAVARSLH